MCVYVYKLLHTIMHVIFIQSQTHTPYQTVHRIVDCISISSAQRIFHSIMRIPTMQLLAIEKNPQTQKQYDKKIIPRTCRPCEPAREKTPKHLVDMRTTNTRTHTHLMWNATQISIMQLILEAPLPHRDPISRKPNKKCTVQPRAERASANAAPLRVIAAILKHLSTTSDIRSLLFPM